jgi:hypothetical protein
VTTATKTKLLLILLLSVAAFLVGPVPQYLQKERLRSELQTVDGRVRSMEVGLRTAELRDLCGQMLLEVLRLNYGSAKDYSSRYFERYGRHLENRALGL